MLHVARKAFHPAPPPFPLLHVDTTWKFRAMYALRERAARSCRHQQERAERSRRAPAHQPPKHSFSWVLAASGLSSCFSGRTRGMAPEARALR